MASSRGAFYAGVHDGAGAAPAYAAGPARYVFAGATRTAAETARDAYATDHAAWRAQYAANVGMSPRYAIRLDVAGADPVWQIVSAVGAADALTWTDVAAIAVVQGERGPRGDAGAGATKAELYATLKTLLAGGDDIRITPDDTDQEIEIGRVHGAAIDRYCGWSGDRSILASEVTAGAHSTTRSITIPATGAGGYLFVWLGTDAPLSAITVGASNLVARFTRATLRVGTTDGALYVSTAPLSRRLANQRMTLT